jgi:hypothetical protein
VALSRTDSDLALICKSAGFLTSLGSFVSCPLSGSTGMAPGVRHKLPLPTVHRFNSSSAWALPHHIAQTKHITEHIDSFCNDMAI